MLAHVLVPTPEEQVLAVRENRATYVAAHVVVALIVRDNSLTVSVGINGVKGLVAGIKVAHTVILGAAALAESLEDHRAFGIFGAVGGHQHLDFGHHVLVDVRNLRTGVAWIDQVGTV